TAFAVEKQRESVVVTVADGKVAVIQGSHLRLRRRPVDSGHRQSTAETTQQHVESGASDAGPAGSVLPRAGSRVSAEQGEGMTIYLTANQQVPIAAAGSAGPVRQIDSQRALAWADGRLIFENNPIAEAVQEFNRYNRVQLHIADPQLARRPVSGVFNC